MIKVIKVNKTVGMHLAGSEVKVKCDREGVPLDVFWRRRLRDAASDNCVEFKMNKARFENKSLNKENRNDDS